MDLLTHEAPRPVAPWSPAQARLLARDCLEGLAWGALFSVTPLGILSMLLPVGGIALLLRAFLRAPGQRLSLGVMSSCACIVMALATQVPVTRGMDRPLRAPLSSRELPVPSLLEELRAQGMKPPAKLPEDAGARVVTLPSLRPSYGELDEALRAQAGLAMDDFARELEGSFLWGMRPERLAIVPSGRVRRP